MVIPSGNAVRYQTVWAILHRLGSVLVRPDRERLSGKVELDETDIAGAEPGLSGERTQGKEVLTATDPIFIGVAEATLAQWRMTGEGLQFVKNGPRQVLYRIGDIRAWIDKNVVASTSAYHAREGR